MSEARRGLGGRLRRGVLGAMAITSLGASPEFSSPALAAEPTEDRTEQEAGKVFESIERSYQNFDTTDPAAIQAQFRLYETNQNIVDQLPPLQQAEFYREWAYTEYVGVGVQYDFREIGGSVDLAKLKARNEFKAQDTRTLQDAQVKVEKSIASVKLAEPEGWTELEQKRILLYKTEQLKQAIETAIDAINADLPEAVSKKEAVIEAIRQAIGQDASEFTVRGEIQQLTITIQVQIDKGSKHNTDLIVVMYDYETGKVKVEVGSYLRDVQPKIDRIVAEQN